MAEPAPARVEVGKVSFVVPADWTLKPGERSVYDLPGEGGKPGGVVSLVAFGALPRGGPPLEERLRGAALAVGKPAGITQVGPPQRLVLGTVPALAVAMPPLGLAAALMVAGELTLLVAVWASEAAFKAVNAFTTTLRPVLPAASVPPLPESGGRAVAGAELPSPRTWVDGPACAANRCAWWVPFAVLGAPAPVRFGAVFEAQPECPLSLLDAALRFVRDACAVLGRTLEPDEAKVRVAAQGELALPDGTIVATVVVDEREGGGALVTRCVASARGTARGAFLVAVATGPWAEGWKERPDGLAPERIWERVDNVADALLSVLVQARPRPLPPIDAAATAALVQRGRYVRTSEWNSSFSSPSLSGAGTFSAYSSGSSSDTWAFGADGTCEVESRRTSSLSTYDTYSTPGGGQHSYSPVLGLWRDPEGKRACRFEVRQGEREGAPLLLVLRDAAGRATFHALELARKGTYGKQEIEGLAIDGEVEGHYASSSGSSGQAQYWKPPA